jgi:hypothetical protein
MFGILWGRPSGTPFGDALWGGPLGKEGVIEDGAARGSDRRGSVSRLNVYITGTAAIIGIIYGYDLWLHRERHTVLATGP